MSLTLWPALEIFSPLLGCLVQPFYMRKCLILLQVDMPCLVGILGRPALFCRERRSGLVGGGDGGQEGGKAVVKM